MRKAYRILADSIAILVAFQAAMMVFAISGLFAWIDDGNSLDTAVIDSWEDDPPTFQGAIGHFLHFMVGQFLIPLIGLALLVVAFFAAVDGAVKWASIIAVSIIVQVAAGLLSGDAPWLGLIHGLNAFALFSVAIVAARAAHPGASAPPPAAPAAPAAPTAPVSS